MSPYDELLPRISKMGLKLDNLKNIVGFSLVAVHLLAAALCFYSLRPRVSPQDFLITMLILSPITATFMTSFVKDVVRNRSNIDSIGLSGGRPVPNAFAALALIFTGAFSIALVYIIADYVNGNNQSPDDLKVYLLIIEIVLGGSFGLVVDNLYEK
jgi:hypothetical protein